MARVVAALPGRFAPRTHPVPPLTSARAQRMELASVRRNWRRFVPARAREPAPGARRADQPAVHPARPDRRWSSC
jgi:hypothetical protein